MHSVLRSDDRDVEPAFDERDVTTIMNGVFHMNVHLARIADEVTAIRVLLEDGDEEEEEENDRDGPHT